MDFNECRQQWRLRVATATARRQFIFWLLQLRSIGSPRRAQLSGAKRRRLFSELEILITAEVLLVSLECADCVSLLSEIRKKLKVPSGSLSLLLLLLIPGLMWRIKNASNWHWPGILAKIDEATLSRRSRAELLSQSLCLTVCSCRGSTYFV